MGRRMLARRLGVGLIAAALVVATASLPAGAESVRPRPGWFVITYDHRITEADRSTLASIGARGVLYRPVDSYVAWLSPSSVTSAAALRHVSGVAPLSPAAKIAPGLAVDAPQPVEVSVLGARMPSFLDRLDGSIRLIRASSADPNGMLGSVVVEADPEAVERVAADPSVLSIGRAATEIDLLDEGAAQIVAGNVKKGRPVPGYRRFLDKLGLDGSGVTIAIADSGIDDNHPDLAGRVKTRIDYTALPDYRDSDGHGTHVAGIAGGSGKGVEGAEDGDGFRYGQGIAPEATFVDLGVLGIIEETVGLDEFPPFERVSRDAVTNGAVAWNASWGSGEGDRAGYTSTARTMDLITRDANWKKRGNQPFTLVFAAGNSGMNGPGAPTEAKNLIAVASSLSHRAGNIDEVSGFSSRGPTRDGRFGPTIAAPGEDIVSTRGLPATVLCNTPPVDASPFAALYATCSGTSMAAPQVTGAVALIHQWWRKANDGADPSAAMTKALLVNSATDMGVPDIPNVNEGWGRVNLRDLFDPSVKRAYVDQSITLDDRGDTYGMRIKPADPKRPMKISLAWSDAPAAPNAKRALVNDLDLTLRASSGQLFRGNRFVSGRSVAGGSGDRREVVENIFLTRARGSYSLRVDAFNLPGDGKPGSGDRTDQDFALVISNAVVLGRSNPR